MANIDFSICVGSSCHLKGSKPVIDAVKSEIEKRGLQSKITLKAAFCLGNCGKDGVSVKVGEEVFTGLTPEKIPAFFDETVLPRLA